MRILIVAGKNPFHTLGGTENTIWYLAHAFAEQGHEVHVTIDDPDTWDKILPWITPVYFPSILHHIPGGFPLNEICYAWKIRRYTHIFQPDIVLDNSSIAFLNTPNPPIVTIAHGTNRGNARSRSIRSFGDSMRFLYRVYRGWLQARVLQRATRVVALSERIQWEIRDLYHIPEEKIHIIHNGTPFLASMEEYQDRLLRTKLMTGIFVSSDHRWKGIHIVEALARKMPERTFLVCGSTYLPKVKNIEYRGSLDPQKLRELYREADFFIMPSQYEWQSLAVLEAMSLGLPIIGGREIDPKIEQSASIGIILEDRQDVEKYMGEIHTLEENTEKLRHIMRSNMERMRSYTWEKQARKYMDLFEEIEKNKS